MKTQSIEVNKDEHIELIYRSKEDLNKYLWDFKLTKFPEDSPIEFGVNLLINPMRFMYHPKAVNSLLNFFKADYDQIMMEQVVEKWADAKQNAADKLQNALKEKKQLDLKIRIESSQLMLPIVKPNDSFNQDLEMWLINLGNFTLRSLTGSTHELSELYQEHYSIDIDSMNARFEPSFQKWQSKNYSLSNQVIQDITMECVVFLNPKHKVCEHGKTYVQVKAPPINVALSPIVYN